MQENSPSEPTPPEIKHLLQEAILRNYPNPDRHGCPGTNMLREAAQQKLPHEHAQWQHITHCSPCYLEFLELRAPVLEERQNRGRFKAAVAAMVVAVLIAVIWFFTFPAAPKVPPNVARHTGGPLVSGSERGTTTVTAVLNMQASPTRGTELSQPGAGDLQRLPRSKMSPLLIYLPFGSDPGAYRIQLLKEEKEATPLATFSGTAEIREGLTVLQVSPDLSTFGPGTYVFSVSRDGGAPWMCRFILS